MIINSSTVSPSSIDFLFFQFNIPLSFLLPPFTIVFFWYYIHHSKRSESANNSSILPHYFSLTLIFQDLIDVIIKQHLPPSNYPNCSDELDFRCIVLLLSVFGISPEIKQLPHLLTGNQCTVASDKGSRTMLTAGVSY